MNIQTTNEDQFRPAAEAAESKMKRASEAVAEVEQALADARAVLAEHENKMRAGVKLPKSFARDGAELQAQVTWHEKLLDRRQDEYAEAVPEYNAAAQELAWAIMRDRSQTIRNFDREDWQRRARAAVETAVAELWDEVYDVQDMKEEIGKLGREYRIADRPDRFQYKDDPIYRKHEIEGYDLVLITISPTYLLEDAVRGIVDPRTRAIRENG